jgi:hypothetical protein
MVKEVLRYPSFLELSLRHSNTFWSSVFKNLAFGKAPYGCYITSSNFLVCNTKAHAFSFSLIDEEKDINQMGKELINTLTCKMNFMSSSDRLRKHLHFKNVKNEIKEKLMQASWVDIRKKKIKDLCIEVYVLKMCQKLCQTTSWCRRLLSSIIICFMFKRIDHTDVAYEYGKILDISVLKVKTNGKWKLCEDIDISAPIVSRGTKVKKKKKRIRDRWSKYIK